MSVNTPASQNPQHQLPLHSVLSITFSTMKMNNVNKFINFLSSVITCICCLRLGIKVLLSNICMICEKLLIKLNKLIKVGLCLIKRNFRKWLRKLWTIRIKKLLSRSRKRALNKMVKNCTRTVSKIFGS